ADYMFTFKFRILDPKTHITFLMRQQSENDRAYRFSIRPEAHQISLSGENIDRTHDNVVLDTAAPITVKGFVLGSLIECFVNDSYAFTRRAYNLHHGTLGIEVENGQIEILDMLIGTPEIKAPPIDDSGFVPIFDGKTLAGWATPEPSYWSVEDGAITGRITPEHPCKINQYPSCGKAARSTISS
ncbi:MAG: hypothetical protein NTU83_07135, partial [Candidatus Hydrogenedentes bacterium]|nr:hypothetical protein [Candidatus Hydrogenedentota bacterium]